MQKQYRTFRRGAVTVVIAMVITAGVAYAVLKSNPATIEGNSINASSAHLQLSADGEHYDETIPGFAFSNILADDSLQPEDGTVVHVRNNGTTRLRLNLTLSMLTNMNHSQSLVELDKFHFALTDINNGAEQREYDFATLRDYPETPLNIALEPGEVRSYKLQLRIHPTAFNTMSELTINGFRISFGGIAERA